MRRRARETGLTLVEMLVVLAIVAVMAGIVVLGIGSGGDRNAEVEAKRLAARLTLAADEAMVSDSPLAIAWDKGSYRFLIRDGGQWRDEPVSALEPHTLSRGVALDATAKSPFAIGSGRPTELRLATAKNAWTVHFDGATAKATPG
jgi:general secretion pathway protein H